MQTTNTTKLLSSPYKQRFAGNENFKVSQKNNLSSNNQFNKPLEGKGCTSVVRDVAFYGLAAGATIKFVLCPPAWVALPLISNFSNQIMFAKKRMLMKSLNKYSRANDAQKNEMLRNSLLHDAGGQLFEHTRDFYER